MTQNTTTSCIVDITKKQPKFIAIDQFSSRVYFRQKPQTNTQKIISEVATPIGDYQYFMLYRVNLCFNN